MVSPRNCSISLRARQLRVVQSSYHPAVSIDQFLCRSQLGILVLQAPCQITQPPEYRPSNVLRAERLLYVFDCIVRLSQVHVRSRKVQSSKGLSCWLALG